MKRKAKPVEETIETVIQKPVFPHPATDEQKIIFEAVENTSDNLLIEARAGSSKTTTIVHAAKLLPPDSKILFLAFNKHIKEELATKLPDYVKCYTSHGLGVSAIKRKYGDKIQFDGFKVNKIIDIKRKTWNLHYDMVVDLIPDYISDIKKLVDLCRLTMTFDKKYIEFLAEKHDIMFSEPKDINRVLSVLEKVIEDKKSYDYVDMVFMPATDKAIWMFQYDYVFVDEAQDLCRAQQEMIRKVLKRDDFGTYKSRLISVGDPKQAIYSFAGSDAKSFEWFKKFNNPKLLTLAVTFRCAQKIVEHAQQLVPDIKARDGAPEGIVMKGSIEDAVDGDFILCRTTAPLVALFFELLAQGKKCGIKGSDIGLSLIDLIKPYKSLATMAAKLHNELMQMQGMLRKKGITKFKEYGAYANLSDKIDVIKFLSKESNDIDDLRKKISEIFTDTVSGIVLSTIHKSKGLEADRVFIIRPDKLPMRVSKPWMAEQEKNLIYVAMTRAKNSLIYDYEWTNEEEDETE
ncbi:MAG: ATP-dependent helicase [Richelia sp. RM2_1_2]|nr:ATP-dependent helicase [Richelia sp. RM2_1_2]